MHLGKGLVNTLLLAWGHTNSGVFNAADKLHGVV